jgi:hypothetical protein
MINALRITSALLPRIDSLTCTDDTADRTWSPDCTGISGPAVPRRVPRARLSTLLAALSLQGLAPVAGAKVWLVVDSKWCRIAPAGS